MGAAALVFWRRVILSIISRVWDFVDFLNQRLAVEFEGLNVDSMKTLPRAIGRPLMASICLYFLLACGSPEAARYNMDLADMRILQFEMHLNNLLSRKGDSETAPQFENDYPPNVEVKIEGEVQFVLDEPFRDPEDESISSRTKQGQINKYGIFLPDFMRDGVYRQTTKQYILQYISSGKWFIICSCGPDERYERDWLADINRKKASLSAEMLRSEASRVSYDPTNGTASAGDLFFIGDGKMENESAEMDRLKDIRFRRALSR